MELETFMTSLGRPEMVEFTYSPFRPLRHLWAVALVAVATTVTYCELGEAGARAVAQGIGAFFLCLSAVHAVLEVQEPRTVGVGGDRIVLTWKSRQLTVPHAGVRLARVHRWTFFASDSIEVSTPDTRFLVFENLRGYARFVEALRNDGARR